MAFLSVFLSQNALAKLKVVTTLPNFASLARMIGGDSITVKSMLGTSFDPHFIEAKPSYVTLLTNADLLISNGLELEVGYLPVLIDQARNSKIRSGGTGSLILGHHVPVMEVPQTRVSRDMGDVHPFGNPHFYMSPDNVPHMAMAIANRLGELDPSGQSQYNTHLQDFLKKWKDQSQVWKKQMSSLGKLNLVTHHKSLNYLIDWLDWNLVDPIEPKPGVPPSSSRLSQLVERAKTAQAQLILLESWYPQKDARFISEKTGVPLLVVDGLTDDYFKSFDTLFGAIKNQLKQ